VLKRTPDKSVALRRRVTLPIAARNWLWTRLWTARGFPLRQQRELRGPKGRQASATRRLRRCSGNAARAVVVGRRGASGAASLLLGSVAHKLVSLSSRPVIVVP
jgi:hypothetical protein